MNSASVSTDQVPPKSQSSQTRYAYQKPKDILSYNPQKVPSNYYKLSHHVPQKPIQMNIREHQHQLQKAAKASNLPSSRSHEEEELQVKVNLESDHKFARLNGDAGVKQPAQIYKPSNFYHASNYQQIRKPNPTSLLPSQSQNSGEDLLARVKQLEYELKKKDTELKAERLEKQKLRQENFGLRERLKMVERRSEYEQKMRQRHQKVETSRIHEEEKKEEGADEASLHLAKKLEEREKAKEQQRKMQEQMFIRQFERMETNFVEEQKMLEQAIQESMQANPNPDQMSYEQLLELEEKIGRVSRGFTEEEINQIPCWEVESEEEGRSCTICQFTFKCGEKVKHLECKHEYHIECIDPWLAQERYCPLCKQEIDIESIV